ncbi:MAG: hypothetical protein N2C14_14070, partial [Planctomycetales bacterium]
MPVLLGVDVGTTTITTSAIDANSGDVLACRTAPNNAETTTPADKKQGRSEWSAPRILQVARDNCKEVALALGDRAAEIA